VVAPVPILTVTIEPGEEIHLHAGGQGFWVGRMCARLGADVVLCGAFGGETGAVLRALIAAEGVDVAGIVSAAHSGAYVHDRRSGERTELAHMAGGPPGRHAIDDLYGAALAAGLGAAVTVLTGTSPDGLIPAAFYERLVTDLRANGRLTVADLSGDALEAAIRGGAAVVKASAAEVYPGADQPDPARLTEWMRAAREAGVGSVIVTRGAAPALALTDHQLLEASPPRVTVRDGSGSGDSLTAAVATALARGSSLRDALALGVAAGTMNVTRSGLGTGRAEDIRAMADKVKVTVKDARDVGGPG
jgi:1-phosphofructokinase